MVTTQARIFPCTCVHVCARVSITKRHVGMLTQGANAQGYKKKHGRAALASETAWLLANTCGSIAQYASCTSQSVYARLHMCLTALVQKFVQKIN